MSDRALHVTRYRPLLAPTLAKWVLGLTTSADIVDCATTAIRLGCDSPHLRRLAGVLPLDESEATSLFERALDELGMHIPPRRVAALLHARHVASQIVASTVAPYQGAKAIWSAALGVRDNTFHDLDPFIYAAAEYEERPSDRPFFESAILKEADILLRHAPMLVAIELLERVAAGTLDASAALQLWLETDERDVLLDTSWHDLSHFAADQDIRAKDPEYANLQRRGLLEHVEALKSSLQRSASDQIK